MRPLPARVTSSARATRFVLAVTHAMVPASPVLETGARPPTTTRYGLAVRVLVLLAVTLAAAGCGASTTPPATTAASAFRGAELEPPRKAPDFALRDQDGKRVRLADERGRDVLVTFLYTHCPDVCPLIAANLNRALEALGERRRGVRVLAVSVDPAGDTPAAVSGYVRRLGLRPEFRYLTGTRAELSRVWRAYGILAVAANKELVDHAAATVLIDPGGNRRVLYDAHVQATDVVHDLHALAARRAAD